MQSFPTIVPGSQVYYAPRSESNVQGQSSAVESQHYHNQENQRQTASKAHEASTQRLLGNAPATPHLIVMHPARELNRITGAPPQPEPVWHQQLDLNNMKDPHARLVHNQNLLQHNRLHHARQMYQRILQFPGWCHALNNLIDAAEVMRESGDLKTAVEAFIFARCLPGGNQNLFVMSHLAETLRQQGRLPEAIVAFETALALPGGKEDPFTVQGHALACFHHSRVERVEAASNLLSLSEGPAASLS